MKQSNLMSFVESTINILVGFGISVAAQAIFLPLLGLPIPWSVNLAFAAIMTVISIARSFALRRLFEALHIRRPLSPFMQAVIAERYAHVEREGWTTEHDDDHDDGELARAGAAYAIYARSHLLDEVQRKSCNIFVTALTVWPWEKRWWKPADFRRDLVKAGALIVAEGEKCDRARKSRRVTSEHQAVRMLLRGGDKR